MDFGVTTMVFYAKPLDKALESIARCGYSYAEIWMEHVWRDCPDRPAERVSSFLEETGLRATVHCPVMDVNVTSPNIGIRKESIRQLFEAMDFSTAIGAQLMVLHPGRRFSVKERFEDHWQMQVDVLVQALARAQDLGLTVALENMEFGSAVHSVKDYDDVLKVEKDCGITDLKVTLDTAHMGDTQRVVQFIEALGPRIVHTHLSDATDKLLHLRIGEGNLDFLRIASALRRQRYSGVYSLETYVPGDERMLRDELEKLARLFG